jgi:hypothetical protein
MKIFKGNMSLWAQLNDVRKMNGPGGIMDTSTYRAAIGSIAIGMFSYFIFWNIEAMTKDFGGWLKEPSLWLYWSPPWSEPPGNIRKYHFYAIMWLILSAIVALFLATSVFLTRRRARKSAEGQWYDKSGLTKADLYGPSHDRHEEER